MAPAKWGSTDDSPLLLLAKPEGATRAEFWELLQRASQAAVVLPLGESLPGYKQYDYTDFGGPSANPHSWKLVGGLVDPSFIPMLAVATFPQIEEEGEGKCLLWLHIPSESLFVQSDGSLVLVKRSLRRLAVRYSRPVANVLVARKRPSVSLSQPSPSSQRDPDVSLALWIQKQHQKEEGEEVKSSLNVPKSLDLPLSVRDRNKAALKRLLLLSLRHYHKQHKGSSDEFSAIYKHLYCACVFAMRAELPHVEIDQATWLSVIRSSMQHLNVK